MNTEFGSEFVEKYEFGRDAPLPTSADHSNTGPRAIISRVRVDCTTKTSTSLVSDYYDDDGRLTGSDWTNPYHSRLALPASPDSPGGRLIALVCSGDQSPSSLAAPNGPPVATPTYYTGTGWLTSTGYVVTASHVVHGARRVALMGEGSVLGDATVVADDPANDVAILEPNFDTRARAGLAIRKEQAALGMHVFTVGFPLPDDLGFSVKVTSGDVSSLSGVDLASGRSDDPRLLQVSIPVQSGNSGGPVIDGSGSVVGVILAKAELDGSRREIIQNVNFALKVSYVAGLLAGLPTLGPHKVPVGGNSQESLVSQVGSAVFLVVAYQ